MKNWLLEMVGAALLGSVAMALCPKGRVRAVTRFVCAVVCMLSLLSPLISAEGEISFPALDDYRAEAETITAEAQEMSENEQRLYIQSQCVAYILTEAQSLGVDVSGASVLARWDADGGAWLPAYCTVEGAYDAALSERIECDLGITREAQRWQE